MATNRALIVNGSSREVSPEPDRSLLSVLRDELDLTGAKYGCGEGECGACTVLLDGQPRKSCRVRLSEIGDGVVTTVEGLADGGALHPVQQAFLETGAMQCGSCTPGMIVRAAALLAANPDPDDAAIAEAMEGNICRCGVYPRILRAVRRAAEIAAAGGAAPAAAAPTDDVVAPFVAEARPERPWGLTPPGERDYFAVLPEGLVVVLPAEAVPPGAWTASGGAWIHVAPDGAVTAFTGKVDVGQDNRTALGLLVAEELRVQADRVRMAMGDTDLCPFDMGTFGSRSTPDAGPVLRAAAAATRDLLVSAAAERWGLTPEALPRLAARDGRVHDESGRSLGFDELVAGQRRVEVLDAAAAVSAPSGWTTAGRPAAKRTGLATVTGARRQPADLSRPGMLHGKVVRPPAFGAALRSVDLADAAVTPGTTAVHEDGFVGVAAETAAGARRALAAIRAEWGPPAPPQPSDADIVDHLRAHPSEGAPGGWGGVFRHEAGDVDAALAAASSRLAATYTAAYIAHVPLEPRAAVAEWDGPRLTVWTGSQRPFGVRAEVAAALGVPEEAVRVIVPDTGGGFGGKHSGECAVEAARLARAAGRPVKVRWTRREELTWAYVRPFAVMDVESGVGPDGALAAWSFTNLNAGSPGIMTPYDVPNQRIVHQPSESPLRQGSYRALAATANHFARESHVDEVARAAGADPLEFRLRHLSDERLAAAFRAAAERAGWGERSRGDGVGLGIAGGVEKDGRVATCAEVRVEPDGRLTLLRVVTAFECGAIVNPDGLTNQIEGATVMGLGGALFEAVRFADGRILTDSLGTYRVPRFSDVPPIEVVLIDRPDIPSAGAGETPIVAIAPAIANAIADATGVRVRSMPLVPDGRVPRGADGDPER